MRSYLHIKFLLLTLMCSTLSPLANAEPWDGFDEALREAQTKGKPFSLERLEALAQLGTPVAKAIEALNKQRASYQKPDTDEAAKKSLSQSITTAVETLTEKQELFLTEARKALGLIEAKVELNLGIYTILKATGLRIAHGNHDAKAKEYADKVATQQEKVAGLAQQIETDSEEIQTLTATFESQNTAQDEKHKAALRDMSQEHEKALADLKAAQKRAVDALRDTHKTEQDNTDRSNMTQAEAHKAIEQQINVHSAAMIELQQENKNALDDLKAKQKQDYEDLESNQADELNKTKAMQEEELAQKREALKTQHQQHEEALKELTRLQKVETAFRSHYKPEPKTLYETPSWGSLLAGATNPFYWIYYKPTDEAEEVKNHTPGPMDPDLIISALQHGQNSNEVKKRLKFMLTDAEREAFKRLHKIARVLHHAKSGNTVPQDELSQLKAPLSIAPESAEAAAAPVAEAVAVAATAGQAQSSPTKTVDQRSFADVTANSAPGDAAPVDTASTSGRETKKKSRGSKRSGKRT